MPYCLKCGIKVEDTMAFCPNCGAALKDSAPSPASAPELVPKQEQVKENNQLVTPQVPLQVRMQQKPRYSFIIYLVAGLILVTVGVSAILELTNPSLASGTYLAMMLLAIGLIVIFGGVYYALSGRKHVTSSMLQEPVKKPAQPTQ